MARSYIFSVLGWSCRWEVIWHHGPHQIWLRAARGMRHLQAGTRGEHTIDRLPQAPLTPRY
eukprot:1735933-Amphidinium_carterae.2